jgi:hypothetical protein
MTYKEAVTLDRMFKELDELRAKVPDLEAALAEAEEDSKRMDYLEGEMAYERRCIEHGQLIPSSLFRRNVPITRAAIDAARKP